MTGWQPIETAPKDGRVIVVRHNRGTWIYEPDQGNISCVCVFWSHGRFKQFGPDAFDENQLTYWMPLPEPPQEEIKPPETFEILGDDRSGWKEFDRTVIEIFSSEPKKGDKE
jgi:hypothetical protein